MTPQAITEEILDILSEAESLTFEVDGEDIETAVMVGIEEADHLFDNGKPFVLINPGQNVLVGEVAGNVATYNLSLLLTGYLPVRDRANSVLGSEDGYPGIFELEAGIKAALSETWPSLNGEAVTFTLTTFEYGVAGHGVGRVVGMEVVATYRLDLSEAE